jgi:hypothetical protein
MTGGCVPKREAREVARWLRLGIGIVSRSCVTKSWELEPTLLQPLPAPSRDGDRCRRPRLPLGRMGLGRQLGGLNEGLHALLGVRALATRAQERSGIPLALCAPPRPQERRDLAVASTVPPLPAITPTRSHDRPQDRQVPLARARAQEGPTSRPTRFNPRLSVRTARESGRSVQEPRESTSQVRMDLALGRGSVALSPSSCRCQPTAPARSARRPSPIPRMSCGPVRAPRS